MPDHFLGDVQFDELLAVVNQERVIHVFGHDDGGAPPSFERLTVACLLLAHHAPMETLINVGAFLNRPAHRSIHSLGTWIRAITADAGG